MLKLLLVWLINAVALLAVAYVHAGHRAWRTSPPRSSRRWCWAW